MSDKIKSPITKGYAKVPVIMQLEALECGAACLAMILAYYRKWIPLEQMRSDCGVSRDGSKAINILKAARFYGLNANGYRFEPEELKEKGQFPCIIHWNFNHFVVLDGFKGDKAVINDPGRGLVYVSAEEFDKSFTGICLMFSPSEEFTPGGKQKSILEFAKKRMQGTAPAVAFIVLTSVITTVIGIIQPGMNRLFIDRLLTGRNPEWFYPYLIALVLLSFIQIIVSWINTVYSLKINGKLDVIGSSTYMYKVLRLPISFFSQRMAGDIQMRKTENASIASSLVNMAAPLFLNAVMIVFYFIVMIRYSVLLSFIGLGSILINFFVSRYISGKIVNITRVQMRDSSKLYSTTVSGIEMIETIKSSGAENGFFTKWAGYQASVNTQNVRFQKTSQYIGLIPSVVSSISNTVVLMLGVYLAINGKFTVGMIMAFQGFLGSFSAPANNLISANQTLQEMRTQMERIEDVMEYPDDKIVAADSLAAHSGRISADIADHSETLDGDGEAYKKLSGNVEIKNISFGYSPLDKPLINDFSLTLKPGSRVALVGSSGCGKSTVAKLISGLYEPWEGTILFDGHRIDEIDRSVFTNSVAVVDQDIILFEDTISNNIKMWDESIEDFEVIMAARDAKIHEDIMLRDGGYNYRLTEGGRDLSGGQKQRIEIARVLAQDPTIIIMDEATSALDARTEYEVINAIKDRGITCIVVAHRLSTIRDCDEIIVLEKGLVKERGTHEELFKNGGLYKELITAE